jgi:hypothetical protein
MLTQNPVFPGIRHPKMRQVYTMCMRCHSTIFWNAIGNPRITRFGDENLTTCLKEGCSLIIQDVGKSRPDESPVFIASGEPGHC